MALSVHIDLGHRPDLDEDQVLAALRGELGDRYEVYKAGRMQVPDVMVKQSERVGAAVALVQRRFRKRTGLRVWGVAPSIALRPHTPVGLARQRRECEPVVQEVAQVLREAKELRPE